MCVLHGTVDYILVYIKIPEAVNEAIISQFLQFAPQQCIVVRHGFKDSGPVDLWMDI